MLHYTIKLLLCLVLFAALPEYIVAKDTKKNIWPTTCYLGLDLAKTYLGWHHKTGPAFELNGSINFRPILLDIDYGFGRIKRDGRRNKGSLAFTSGQYVRIGVGYNFLSPTLDQNQFFIGFRYARSFFDFQLKSTKLQCNHPPDEACKPEPNKPYMEPCKELPKPLREIKGARIAHWWEFVVGGRVYIMPLLSIGCTARYKFGKKIENKLMALPFDIPGFGLAEFDDAFGYSLYILIRIPLQNPEKVFNQNFAQKSTT